MAWRWVFAASDAVVLSVGIGGGCVHRLKKHVQFKSHRDSVYDMKDREEGAGSSGLSWRRL